MEYQAMIKCAKRVVTTLETIQNSLPAGYGSVHFDEDDIAEVDSGDADDEEDEEEEEENDGITSLNSAMYAGGKTESESQPLLPGQQISNNEKKISLTA